MGVPGAGPWLSGSPVQEYRVKGFSASGSNPKGAPWSKSWCVDTRERLVGSVRVGPCCGFAGASLPFSASTTWPENRGSSR